jgi:hypothetical protein
VRQRSDVLRSFVEFADCIVEALARTGSLLARGVFEAFARLAHPLICVGETLVRVHPVLGVYPALTRSGCVTGDGVQGAPEGTRCHLAHQQSHHLGVELTEAQRIGRCRDCAVGVRAAQVRQLIAQKLNCCDALAELDDASCGCEGAVSSAVDIGVVRALKRGFERRRARARDRGCDIRARLRANDSFGADASVERVLFHVHVRDPTLLGIDDDRAPGVEVGFAVDRAHLCAAYG